MQQHIHRLFFSGHESFICKQFWLKKVFDFTNGNKRFNDGNAVVELGVGKNMVASMRFWGKAFGMLDNSESPTEIANYLFGEKGIDVYLEDFRTIWLLHYYLVKTNKASIYNLVFNEFRKERIDFTKEQLLNFCLRKSKEYESNTDNKNTIDKDVNVFLRTYVQPQKDEKVDIEDDFSAVLIDLDLIKHYKQQVDSTMVHWYKIEGQERTNLPFEVVLYTILDNYGEHKSITFHELHTGYNSPGMIFALNEEGLYNKLQQITQHYKQVVYTETAGNRLLQINPELKQQEVLNDYYPN